MQQRGTGKREASRSSTDKSRSDAGSSGTVFVLATQLGFSIACPMVFFIGGGAWLGNQLGWAPWPFLIGIVLGIAVAGGLLYQIAKVPTGTRPKTPPKVQEAPYKVEQAHEPPDFDPGTTDADNWPHNGN